LKKPGNCRPETKRGELKGLAKGGELNQGEGGTPSTRKRKKTGP